MTYTTRPGRMGETKLEEYEDDGEYVRLIAEFFCDNDAETIRDALNNGNIKFPALHKKVVESITNRDHLFAICDCCGRATDEYETVSTSTLAGVVMCSGSMKESCREVSAARINEQVARLKKKERTFYCCPNDHDEPIIGLPVLMKPGDLVRIKQGYAVGSHSAEGIPCLLVKMPHSNSKLGIAGVVPLGAENIKPVPVYLRYLELIEKQNE